MPNLLIFFLTKDFSQDIFAQSFEEASISFQVKNAKDLRYYVRHTSSPTDSMEDSPLLPATAPTLVPSFARASFFIQAVS